MEQVVKMKLREDVAGSGKFGAPRGSRKHNGIDFVCEPGATLLSPVAGKFTKYGYCYGDDLSFRYVQITDDRGLNHRFFYVMEPMFKVGMQIWIKDPFALADDITRRYPGRNMLPHIHYEVMDEEGNHLNPLSLG